MSNEIEYITVRLADGEDKHVRCSTADVYAMLTSLLFPSKPSRYSTIVWA